MSVTTATYRLTVTPLIHTVTRGNGPPDCVSAASVLAVIHGERGPGGRVSDREHGVFRVSGCGRLMLDDTLRVSDSGRPSRDLWRSSGRAVRVRGGTGAHGRQQRAVVEELLVNGLLSCPGCDGQLGGRGHAARRRVFSARRVPVGLRPRRARCGSCGVTHVLLPARLLARRCDGTAVIGDMLARVARGQEVPGDRGRDGGAGGYGAGAGCAGSACRRAGCGSSSPGWPGLVAGSGAAGPGGESDGRRGGDVDRPVGVERRAEDRVIALGVEFPQHPVVGHVRW